MKCVQQMSALEYRAGEESAWCKNRLRSEVRNLRSDPPDGIQAIPLDSLCSHWQATLVGPEGSVYEGGTFFLYIQIPYTYPMSPPLVRFITKIFHPNISRHGDIGIDSINTNWSLALTIGKVLISIQSILTDPVCDVSTYLNYLVVISWIELYLKLVDLQETVMNPGSFSYSRIDGAARL